MLDSKSTINAIYQFNEKYVPYAGVSMTSLLVNNTDVEMVNIYVLGEDLSEESVIKLRSLAGSFGRSISFPDTSSLLAKFKGWGMIPYRGAYSIYLRLFFSEIIALKGERAIYLDSDTIVDGSLLPLVNYDLGDKSMGMVLESIRDDYKIMIGMAEDSDYYNSGMILFDVDKWRSRDYCNRLKEHILNVRSGYIGDQDFLNIVCEGDVALLPPRYNFQPLHGRYTDKQYYGVYKRKGYYDETLLDLARTDTAIYHCYRWLGEFPWNDGNLHPFNTVFDKYMEMSEWSGYSKQKASLSLALKIEKALYRILPRPIFLRIFRTMHELVLKKAEDDARKNRANERS